MPPGRVTVPSPPLCDLEDVSTHLDLRRSRFSGDGDGSCLGFPMHILTLPRPPAHRELTRLAWLSTACEGPRTEHTRPDSRPTA